MDHATITINASNVIGEAHDHLYGANLEHIGQAIYGGIWAEMLRDRKFAGCDRQYTGLSEGLHNAHPSFGIVAPWVAENPRRDTVIYTHDNSTFYTGSQSQRITFRQADKDDQERGIKQGSLYLQAERDYELRLVVKGEGQSLNVQLGGESWRIDGLSGEWRAYQRTFTRAGDDAKGELRLTISEGTAWIGCASLMPNDNIAGFRSDVIAALRDWSPTQLRWPGGNFVSAYHWQMGIGDRDKRPAYLDPAWWLWEQNDLGTDEFVTLCRLIGAEPVLTINMGDGTVEEARAWVEYCNGDAGSEYGALRAANGFVDPHDVNVWFIGNEQFGNWQVGHVDAETYANRYLEFARAMRSVDEKLRLIGVGVPTDRYGHWNERVLGIAGAEMDAYSVHYYSLRTEKQEDTPAPETIYLPKMAAWHEVAGMLDGTLAIMDANGFQRLPLAFDEWNTYVGAKPPDFIEDYNLADALYTASLLNLCLQRADRINYSAIYHLINVMGNYLVTPLYQWDAIYLGRGGGWVQVSTGDDPDAPAVVKLPGTLVLELMTRYRGAIALETGVDCDSFASPAAGNQPAFDDVPLVNAATTFDADRRRLFLSVVNCGVEGNMRVRLSGIDTADELEQFTVAGEHPLSTNSVAQPANISIEHSRVSVEQITLPPHSFSLLVIDLA